MTRTRVPRDAVGGCSLQLGLFTAGVPSPDLSFGNLIRHPLGERSWVDHAPGWLGGSDEVCEVLAARAAWNHGRRRMYDRMVDEPRLTQWYGRHDVPFPHPVIAELFDVLSTRYRVHFDSVGLNYYRDGADSVAWHGDRVARSVPLPLVAIISVGEPRPFQLRPAGGGRSLHFALGSGDLLVMGGDCQREFEHRVPKVALAGPRISITFRHSAPGSTTTAGAAGGDEGGPPGQEPEASGGASASASAN